MYEERETFEPANLSIVAMRSLDNARDVVNFILPLYYQGRMTTITSGIRADVVDVHAETEPPADVLRLGAVKGELDRQAGPWCTNLRVRRIR